MPAPSDFGDGATVIEGATPSQAYAHGAHVPPGGSSGRGKGVETSSPAKTSGHRDSTSSTFAKTTDYFSEERPFVVLIGKNGVIGALRELDEHLRNVCMNFFFLPPSLFTLVSLRTTNSSCVCVGCSRDITRSFLTRCVIVAVIVARVHRCNGRSGVSS